MNVIPRHVCDIGKFDRDPEKQTVAITRRGKPGASDQDCEQD